MLDGLFGYLKKDESKQDGSKGEKLSEDEQYERMVKEEEEKIYEQIVKNIDNVDGDFENYEY